MDISPRVGAICASFGSPQPSCEVAKGTARIVSSLHRRKLRPRVRAHCPQACDLTLEHLRPPGTPRPEFLSPRPYPILLESALATPSLHPLNRGHCAKRGTRWPTTPLSLPTPSPFTLSRHPTVNKTKKKKKRKKKNIQSCLKGGIPQR